MKIVWHVVALLCIGAILHQPALAQVRCGGDPFLVRTDVEVNGTSDRQRAEQEKAAWRRVATPILDDRCPRCLDPDNPRDRERAEELDRRRGAPGDLRPLPPRVLIRPTGAILKITVDLPAEGGFAARQRIQAHWTQYLDAEDPQVSSTFPVERSRTKDDHASLLHQLLNSLRRNPTPRCVIEPRRDDGTRLLIRMGVWTEEIVTEQDLTGRNDVRVGTLAVGLAREVVVSGHVRVRARAEVGRGGLYLSENGESWLANGSSGPVPGDFWTLVAGGDAIYRTSNRRGAPSLTAGADVRIYTEGRRDLPYPTAEWTPYVVLPFQRDFGVSLGVGAPWLPVEFAARLGSPAVKFIGDEKAPSVWELSVAMQGPYFRTLRGR